MFILNTLSSAGLNVWFASLFGGSGGGKGGGGVGLICSALFLEAFLV